MSAPLVVSVLAAGELGARDAVAAGLLLDSDRTALLSYHHDRDAAGRLRMERRLIDLSGVVYVDRVDGDNDCACCRLREDLPQTVEALVAGGRWDRLLLAPPLAAPVQGVAVQLDELAAGPGSGLRLASVLAVLDLDTVVEDLFGDDLLDERGAALSPEDRRSVGEAVAEHIDYADLVVGAHGPAEDGSAVLGHLAGHRWRADWTELSGADVFGGHHDVTLARRRVDPLQVQAIDAPREDHPDVWTLDLHSRWPVHPGRLMDRLSDLGTGRIRARGYVWLTSRPQQPCAWDASGGQLSIGALSGWGSRAPATRLVVTGVVAEDRERIAQTFAEVVCRPDEAGDPGPWSSGPDGFEPWLGTPASG